MCGIAPNFEHPGFKNTTVSPYFDKSVSNLKMSLRTKNGVIKVDYKIMDDVIHYYIKGDQRIEFEFKFQNKVISKKEISKNEFVFDLQYK